MKPALRESKRIKLCRSKELTSAVVSIAQVIFSSITIYRARGDQIKKYGFAAYGLSVYPYLLMLVANLIKSAVCGRYPYAYVLRTATLVEAENNGGVFEGAVGNLWVNHGEDDNVANDSQDGNSMVFSDPPPWMKYVSIPWSRPLGDYRGCQRIVPIIGSLIFYITFFSHLVIVIVLAGATGDQGYWTFNAGQSTRTQATLMIGWLIANFYAPFVDKVVSCGFGGLYRMDHNQRVSILVGYVAVFIAYAYAFGGFVTVGGMLHAESSYQPC